MAVTADIPFGGWELGFNEGVNVLWRVHLNRGELNGGVNSLINWSLVSTLLRYKKLRAGGSC